MLSILLLSALGLGVAYAIYDHYDDDEDPAPPGETLVGTDGPDALTGTERDDLLSGLGGDDSLSGGAGDDRMLGGEGSDAMVGGEGDDLMRGQADNDALFGRAGDDRLAGDTGSDWIDGGQGDDALKGGYGSDLLIGGEGTDALEGGANDDALFGGKGPLGFPDATGVSDLRDDLANGFLDDPSRLVGREVEDDGDPDTLDGGDGDDALLGGSGDTMTGGTGADLFVLLDGAGVDPASITDYDPDEDALVCQYDGSQPEPALELTDNGDGTQTLTADGIAIALLNASSLSVSDIALVPRGAAA